MDHRRDLAGARLAGMPLGSFRHPISSQANRVLEYLLAVMRPVALRQYTGPPPWLSLRDSDDEPIWATAVLGHAQYVVSHNTADFPPLVPIGDRAGRHGHIHNGIEYLTAVEFIQDVLGIDAAGIYGRALPRVLVRSRRGALGALFDDAQQSGPNSIGNPSTGQVLDVLKPLAAARLRWQAL